jgi:hypothetical protein
MLVLFDKHEIWNMDISGMTPYEVVLPIILGNTLILSDYKSSISESTIEEFFFSELYKIHINTTNMYLVG